MDKNFAIIRQVCEHAQATGIIKTLADAVAVQNALQSVAQRLDEVESLKRQVEKLLTEKSNNELHS